MEILEKLLSFVLSSLFFAPIVKLVVDFLKMVIGDIKTPEYFYYYVSCITGTLLGALFLPELGYSLVEGIVIGLVAGSTPAPILHDMLKTLKRIKDLLKESILEEEDY